MQVSKIIFNFFLFFMLFACATSPSIEKDSVSQIYVFGDSLSDRGNAFYLRNLLSGLDDIHVERALSNDGLAYSDGSLIVEQLAAYYQLKLIPAWKGSLSQELTYQGSFEEQALVELIWQGQIDGERALLLEPFMKARLKRLLNINHPNNGNNFAVAGATVSANYQGVDSLLSNAVSLAAQISLYRHLYPEQADPRALFFIAIGANDLLKIVQNKPSQQELVTSLTRVAISVRWAIEQLLDYGAQRILLLSVPDLGILPQIVGDQADYLSRIALAYERGLQSILKQLPIEWVSLRELQRQAIKEWPPEKRQLACLESQHREFNLEQALSEQKISGDYINDCKKSLLGGEQFPYFDNYHASGHLYQGIAELLRQQLPADWTVQELIP